jgi:4-hydroxy-4-methyl-2-oxoglutarate aldolase
MKSVPYEIIMERLSSCILSDVLDGMGFRYQAMGEWIRPLYPSVVVGRAHTMLMAEVQEPEEDTFALQIEGIDRLGKDDVMVVASNRSTKAALWGELLSTAARCRGARGGRRRRPGERLEAD